MNRSVNRVGRPTYSTVSHGQDGPDLRSEGLRQMNPATNASPAGGQCNFHVPGIGGRATPCAVVDCSRAVASHGMCGVHWKRMQRRGHTDKVERSRNADQPLPGYDQLFDALAVGVRQHQGEDTKR